MREILDKAQAWLSHKVRESLPLHRSQVTPLDLICECLLDVYTVKRREREEELIYNTDKCLGINKNFVFFYRMFYIFFLYFELFVKFLTKQ